MFMDIPAGGEGGFEPFEPRCRSCKQPIARGVPHEILTFPAVGEHRLEKLNGTYHTTCARPLASLQRALDMLTRSWS